MSKAGRRPKTDVPRGENGKIKTSHYKATRAERRERIKTAARIDERAIAGWRIQQDMARRAALNPLMNSILGRMLVWGDPRKIVPAEMEAGRRLAQLFFEYDRKILCTVTTPQAIDLSRVRGLALTDDSAARIDGIRRRYDALLRWLSASEADRSRLDERTGRRMLTRSKDDNVAALRDLCFHDAMPADIDQALVALRIVTDEMRLYDNPAQRIRRWQDGEAREARRRADMVPADWQDLAEEITNGEG